jgi:hypothetical protein
MFAYGPGSGYIVKSFKKKSIKKETDKIPKNSNKNNQKTLFLMVWISAIFVKASQILKILGRQ